MRNVASVALLLVSAACVDAEPDDAVDQTEQGIVNGDEALEWMYQRAVKPEYPCSGTLIGSRYVLTALHCTNYNNVGETVHFYTDADGFDPVLERTITHVLTRPGTDADDDYWDVNGQYSDLAILRLSGAAPPTSVPALLGWEYPGTGAKLTVVGGGNHDGAGYDNDIAALRYTTEFTTTDDADGLFHTDVHATNPGDSGGPLYRGRMIFGVVHGGTHHASVPEHLDWILGQIGYGWSHGAAQLGTYRTGTVVDTFWEATERMCQYACDHMRCNAYNWVSSNSYCVLVKDLTGTQANSAYRSDAK